MTALARSRPPELKTSYPQLLSIAPGTWQKAGIAFGMLLVVAGPWIVPADWVTTLVFSGVAVLGATGLNLLSGYTGQVSLGHSAFLGFGAYTAAYLVSDVWVIRETGAGGIEEVVGVAPWAFPAAIVAGGLVAMAVGALIGPIAFRLKGLYLSIVTLGLVFVAEYIFRNWDSVTGGATGRAFTQPTFFGFEMAPPRGEDTILGVSVDRNTRYYYLIWIIAIAGCFFAKNIARSRTGRAFQAVRDREIAASISGIGVRSTKLKAFMISSFMAGVAGALFGAFSRYISPEASFTLLVSIQYIAMIIIGGIGTIWGSIAGAVFITALPRLVEEVIGSVGTGEVSVLGHLYTDTQVSTIIYGIVLVLFLLFEPLGLYGIWIRIKAYFLTWPFKY